MYFTCRYNSFPLILFSRTILGLLPANLAAAPSMDKVCMYAGGRLDLEVVLMPYGEIASMGVSLSVCVKFLAFVAFCVLHQISGLFFGI